MERISTVARDCSSRPIRSWWVLLAFCVSLTATLDSLVADSPRSPTVAKKPSRPVRQSQVASDQTATESETRASDGFDDVPQSQPKQTASSSELPEHVHPDHPLVPALKMAYASRATLSKMRDYTAHFVKKELVGTGYITHNMDMKFRTQPFSVYLRFRDPHEGRQVLFVKGANGGKILVQEKGLKGLAGTIPLDPSSPLALSENRHPISDIGIANMLDSVIRQWELEGKYGGIDVKYFPQAKLGEYPVKVIRTSHPKRYRQFKYHTTQLYLDEKSLFPVRVEQYDWPQREGENPVQVELYMYSSVRTNQGLSNADFDPRIYGM